MATNFDETPFWRTKYAPKTSDLLSSIPSLLKRTKMYIENPENSDYVTGFSTWYRILYLTVCNRGENTGTQTMESTENALKYKRLYSRDERKTNNLSRALTYIFGESLFVDSLPHEFNADLAKKLNGIIGDGLFDNPACYRRRYAKPAQTNHLYLAPHLIEEHINQLFKEIKKDMENAEKSWYEIASSFLSKFLYIHPFSNGNGRTARLLVSALLINYSIVPVPLFLGYDRGNTNSMYVTYVVEAQCYGNPLLLNSLIIESVHDTMAMFVNCLDID